jgi:hypothetical protein
MKTRIGRTSVCGVILARSGNHGGLGSAPL